MAQAVTHIAVIAALVALIVTGHLDPEVGVAYVIGLVSKSPVEAVVQARREKNASNQSGGTLDPRSVPDA